MNAHNSKIIGEGLTYDDVLLVPNYSNVLPREVSIQSRFSRNITLNVPVVSAAMDTVTESSMAIAPKYKTRLLGVDVEDEEFRLARHSAAVGLTMPLGDD